jgi:ribosomal protein S12 methylthiotransferase
MLRSKMKTGLISLGCPKNRVDSEYMLGILKKNGYTISNDENECDVIIVNTCGFIDNAKEESIETILEMAQYKEKNCKALIVTGCLSQRYKEEVIKEIPEVDAVLGTTNYMDIAGVIEKAINGEKKVECTINDKEVFTHDERILTNDGVYAYLKIAEGCNNNCTYCIIPALRGKYRSRSVEDIVEEARKLASYGKSELILIAQDITGYGEDLYGKIKLVFLLRELSKIDKVKRIRLLYTYPDRIDDDLIKEIKQNSKICKYLDIPIQHISNSVLKKMGRRGNKSSIKHLIKKLRDEIPDIVLRTSLITGFPGETEENHNELLDFVKETKFEWLGVFKYSSEEGTKASEFKNQVEENIKENRYKSILSSQKELNFSKNCVKIDNIIETAVEGIADDGIFYYGRSEGQAPDIDGKVYFTSSEPLDINTYVKVRVLNYEAYDLIGEVINEFTE